MSNQNDDAAFVELPDGSGCFTASLPLPPDHWLFNGEDDAPPMGLRCGQGTGLEDLYRAVIGRHVSNAVRYALRVSTKRGTEKDFDPDAVVQSTLVGLFGYHTPTGTGTEDWHNPNPIPAGVFSVLNELLAGKNTSPPLYKESEPTTSVE